MAGVVQPEPAIGRNNGAHQLVYPGELDLCGDEVEDGEGIHGAKDLVAVELDLVGEVPQQAVDLDGLVVFEGDDEVVEFDGLGGLDEEGRAGL